MTFAYRLLTDPVPKSLSTAIAALWPAQPITAAEDGAWFIDASPFVFIDVPLGSRGHDKKRAARDEQGGEGPSAPPP